MYSTYTPSRVTFIVGCFDVLNSTMRRN